MSQITIEIDDTTLEKLKEQTNGKIGIEKYIEILIKTDLLTKKLEDAGFSWWTPAEKKEFDDAVEVFEQI